MFRNILVPLDGSPASEQAARLAISLARNNATQITVMQAVSDSDALWGAPYDAVVGGNAEELVQANVAEATAYLGKVAKMMLDAGVSNVTVKAQRGAAAETISALASNGYDLIVMNTHGRSGLARTVLGSVAMAVVRSSHLPVLLVNNIQAVKDYADSDYLLDNILVPLDGSPLAELALPTAVKLAQANHGKLLLLKVLAEKAETEVYIAHEVGDNADGDSDYVLGNTELDDYRYLEDVADRCIPAGLAYITIACAGKPARDIVSSAIDHHCKLIAMTTHARAGIRRITEGSVTEAVIANSPIPVLALRGLVIEQQREPAKVKQLALTT